MSYQVLARKWRPGNFSELVGQEAVQQALSHALQQQRLHHAYLFTGTRGVGKTTIARIFAKSLNCETGVTAEPCGQCSSCTEIEQGRFVDLIEVDAASRTGVDSMRELLDNVQYAPSRGRYKVYLIDEVHMLSNSSFNALLKTLEEPPPHVKFLLATTDPQKMPATVLSRCLQFALKKMPQKLIAEHLRKILDQESIHFEPLALQLLAHAAEGSMRDALSLLDQAIAYAGGAIEAQHIETMLGVVSAQGLLSLLQALAQEDGAALISQSRKLSQESPDFLRLCALLMEWVQQLALYKVAPEMAELEEAYASDLQQLAETLQADTLQLYYQILLQGRQNLALAGDEAHAFEMLMLRLLAFTPEELPLEKKSP